MKGYVVDVKNGVALVRIGSGWIIRNGSEETNEIVCWEQAKKEFEKRAENKTGEKDGRQIS